jgi:hypothetical protein
MSLFIKDNKLNFFSSKESSNLLMVNTDLLFISILIVMLNIRSKHAKITLCADFHY